MTGWTPFVNQLPLLLICIPICGVATISLISLIGREHLRRTLLLNGMLTFGCALAILFQFQSGSERTRLSPADSFQSAVEISRPGSASGLRFGVDGCSLLLILFTSALPLFVVFVWKPPESTVTAPPQMSDITCGRAVLLLLLQTLLLIFLTALDRRVQLVTLLSSTCVLFVVLSISSPTGRRIRLNRRQQQFLLSDFLIAGGILASLTPLVRLSGIGNSTAVLFDVRRLLAVVELLRDEELTQYVRLMSAVTPALALMLAGCSIRFGMFPFSRAARTMWEATAPWQRLLIWAHGPLLGTAVVLRELQVFPVAAYQVAAWFKILWLPGLFLSAVVARLSAGSRREAAMVVYFSSLLFFSLTGPNTVSLAGAFLLLAAVGLRLTIAPDSSDQSSAIRHVRSVSRFLMSAGVICALIGDWQGLGAASRGLGLSLATGLSLLILGNGGQRHSRRAGRTAASLLSTASHTPAAGSGEQPVWDVPPPPASASSPVHRHSTLRSAGLVLAACLLLLLPNFLWQRIRWDLQKIEFPQGEIALSAREDRP